MEDFGHIAFTNETLRPGAGSLKAGLVTSLGFGHVSGIALILHPDALLAHLPKNTRDAYQAVVDERLRDERDRLTDILLGTETAFSKRTHRRFKADDGTEAQEVEEREMLTRTEARFDPIANAFVTDENRS
jgi:fatty acid synthase